MNNNTDTKNTSTEPPAPEALKPQGSASSADSSTLPLSRHVVSPAKKLKRGTYRPSHRATFTGLAVVVVILVVNAAVIFFVIRGQDSATVDANQTEVTLSTENLDKLGVSRTPVGNRGTELVVGPNSRFNGNVTVGSNVNIAGELTLNSKFSASNASLTNLQAGETSLTELNVNGDATASSLDLREGLTVAGATQLQGSLTVSQLVTVNNNMNVSGNLSVGGTLSARSFQASSLTSDTTLTIGGHIITRGTAPGVTAGNGLGSNGSVSISGNDAAGTVATNIGTGSNGGILAYVTFRNQYDSTPHVVITPIGRGVDAYVNRTAAGFSIGVTGAIPAGGLAFDYIVVQ